MEIRQAKPRQLAEISHLVQTSITQLCEADHHRQQQHLANWLRERSAEKLHALMFNTASQAFVCLQQQIIIGVAHITRHGELTLCYVHPQHAGAGVGRLLLAAVESQALAWGIERISLISTTTARQFYLAHGYTQYSEPVLYIGMAGYPLQKHLGVAA